MHQHSTSRGTQAKLAQKQSPTQWRERGRMDRNGARKGGYLEGFREVLGGLSIQVVATQVEVGELAVGTLQETSET